MNICLIAEDRDGWNELENMLEEEGKRVTRFSEMQHALNALRAPSPLKREYGLILLDLDTPFENMAAYWGDKFRKEKWEGGLYTADMYRKRFPDSPLWITGTYKPSGDLSFPNATITIEKMEAVYIPLTVVDPVVLLRKIKKDLEATRAMPLIPEQ